VESLLADVESLARFTHSAIAGDGIEDGLEPLLGELGTL
jgi:hypothetical protein